MNAKRTNILLHADHRPVESLKEMFGVFLVYHLVSGSYAWLH